MHSWIGKPCLLSPQTPFLLFLTDPKKRWSIYTCQHVLTIRPIQTSSCTVIQANQSILKETLPNEKIKFQNEKLSNRIEGRRQWWGDLEIWKKVSNLLLSPGSLFSSLGEFNSLKPHSSQPLSAHLPPATMGLSVSPPIQAYRPILHRLSQGTARKKGEDDETKGNGGRGGYN